MAIDGMKVVDLDSHLVGDLESWDQTVEDKWRPFLPSKLPTKDNERRKTLVGNRIMIGSELGRQKAEKNEWFKPEPISRPRAACATWISTASTSRCCRPTRRRSIFSGSSMIRSWRRPMRGRRTIT